MSSEAARLRNNLLNLLAVAIGIVLAAVVVELTTRYVFDNGMNFDLEMWKYATNIKVKSDNPEISFEHRPNKQGTFMGVTLVTNALGLRNREIALEKKPGVTRVLMLGDSLTLGWGVPEEETTSRLLERLLNKDGEGRFEVINAGVGNYNTSMEVTSFLTREYKLHPDIVVLNYFVNDAEVTPREDTNPLLMHSYAAVFLAGKLEAVWRQYLWGRDWLSYYSDLYAKGQPGWLKAQAAIRSLAAYCKKNGIALVVVSLPELHELKPYPFAKITEAVRRVAEENGVPFLDLLPAIEDLDPKSLWVSPTDAHPNSIADQAFAESIDSFLRSLGLIHHSSDSVAAQDNTERAKN
jgi:lysophospholipase L1-like esterase